MRLFVGNLSPDTRPDDVREIFELFGTVRFARIVNDKETGLSRGFAFVEMPYRTECQSALAALNGTELNGQPLKIKIAEERETW